MGTKIIIGTRGSKLALWQAHYIQDLLKSGGIETEVITIETKGDKILDRSLSSIGSKGLFTEELEEKLISGEIDIAVHSAKDMQSELNEGLEIIAFTEREESNDVLVSFDKDFNLNDASKELIVGSSSTRRKATLRRLFPHLKIVEARGNLQTRFKKMEEGQFQAMMLAYAGVHRMGYDDKIVRKFTLEEFIPAVGQGAIAIEIASSLAHDKKSAIRKLVNHSETEKCLLAERAFLHKLQGGCSIPVFALAEIKNNAIEINGGVISLDGKELVKEKKTGSIDAPEQLGKELAEEVILKGGKKILDDIKK